MEITMLLVLVKIWNFFLSGQEKRVQKMIETNNYPRYF